MDKRLRQTTKDTKIHERGLRVFSRMRHSNDLQWTNILYTKKNVTKFKGLPLKFIKKWGRVF